jgi:hypothetical protein
MHDLDLDDEPMEDGDGGIETIGHDDEDTITPEAEQAERLKSQVNSAEPTTLRTKVSASDGPQFRFYA